MSILRMKARFAQGEQPTDTHHIAFAHNVRMQCQYNINIHTPNMCMPTKSFGFEMFIAPCGRRT